MALAAPGWGWGHARKKKMIKFGSVSTEYTRIVYTRGRMNRGATARDGEVCGRAAAGLITIIKIKRAAPIWQLVVADGSLDGKQANSIFQIKSRPMIYGWLRRCIWRRVTNLAGVNWCTRERRTKALAHLYKHTLIQTHTHTLIII